MPTKAQVEVALEVLSEAHHDVVFRGQRVGGFAAAFVGHNQSGDIARVTALLKELYLDADDEAEE